MADLTQISISISIGALAAIIYALRMVNMMDLKINKIMKHLGISEINK